MALNEACKIRFVLIGKPRRKFRAAASPARKPLLTEERRRGRVSACCRSSRECDRGSRFRSGARALRDKKTRRQQRGSHGSRSRIRVELHGFRRAQLKNSLKDGRAPKRGVGFIRERIVKNQIGSCRRFDQVAKLSF